MSNHLPSPPRVFAPDRLGTDAPAGSLGPVPAGHLSASAAPAPRAEGAQVTAVVGPPTVGTPAPPVTTPQVAAPTPPPGTELARTGFDSGPVLLLALVLVLLGLALVRLAVPRATSSL